MSGTALGEPQPTVPAIPVDPKATGGTGGRSVAVDLVRVVGVIAIVVAHNWDPRIWAHTWFYTWHVPVFFIITGYLWKPGRSTWDETKRRARTLLVPYVFWIVIVTVIWLGFRAMRGEPFDHRVIPDVIRGGWYISRPYSAYWFVTALFFAAVIMRFAQNVSPFLPWFLGGVGVVWCILDPSSIKHIWEAAGLALPAVLFICLGTLLRRFRSRIDKPFLFGLILFLPAFLLGARGIIATLNMKSGNLGTPIAGVLMAAAISFGLVLMAEGAEHLAPGWARRWVTILAQTAIPVILTHTLVLAMTERLGLEASKITFLLAYFIPVALALCIRLTPLRRVLL
jgi:fucose 4-O-acetylase-like acetyltransferase